MKRPRVDVDLGELDQLLDHACEAPLSQGESARIKEALHALAEVLLSRRTSAVSYTHLRAHETVLDLVCRLLLEKKNHIPYQRLHDLEYSYSHSRRPFTP